MQLQTSEHSLLRRVHRALAFFLRCSLEGEKPRFEGFGHFCQSEIVESINRKKMDPENC